VKTRKGLTLVGGVLLVVGLTVAFRRRAHSLSTDGRRDLERVEPVPNLTLRRAEKHEARLIAELHVRAWQAAYRGLLPDELLDGLSVAAREALWRRKLAIGSRSHVWVAERGERVIGFVAVGPSRDGDTGASVAEVYAIYVEPEVVGTGVGRVLFKHAMDFLRGHGYGAAILWVLETNARARRFYEGAGWQPDGAMKTELRQVWELKEVRYRTTL
jgi:GNAT superfamily N-acetyltransferase